MKQDGEMSLEVSLVGVVREGSEKKKSEPRPEQGQEARQAMICGKVVRDTVLRNPGLQIRAVCPIV